MLNQSLNKQKAPEWQDHQLMIIKLIHSFININIGQWYKMKLNVQNMQIKQNINLKYI